MYLASRVSGLRGACILRTALTKTKILRHIRQSWMTLPSQHSLCSSAALRGNLPPWHRTKYILCRFDESRQLNSPAPASCFFACKGPGWQHFHSLREPPEMLCPMRKGTTRRGRDACREVKAVKLPKSPVPSSHTQGYIGIGLIGLGVQLFSHMVFLIDCKTWR